MEEGRKRILVVTPSSVLSKGLEGVLAERGEFDVAEVLSDLSRVSGTLLRNMDVVVLDPQVLDYSDRQNIRALLPECAGVVALRTVLAEDELYRQFDDTIGLYDSPVTIVHKLRKAAGAQKETQAADSSELSAREKEILVCVAQGMLNKEIADRFNLSVYTVISHRKNITRKTGIKTVAGLTVYALLNNLIEPNILE